MIVKRRDSRGRLRYHARVYRGNGAYEHGRTRDTRREAKDDEAQLTRRQRVSRMTCEQYAERFLAEYGRTRKSSSFDTARASLRPFLERFGHRQLGSISRVEAKEWVLTVKPSRVPIVTTLFNSAVEDELIERNSFRGLAKRSRGRGEMAPPTEDELGRLLSACSVLDDYAPMMRALIQFAAYSGMRPGELFALEWDDIDFDTRRIQVRRRLYRGSLDLPKANKAREVALTPPARDALLGLPRAGSLVFSARRGGRLSQSLLSGYWAQVLASARLDFDFYLATRHFCAHYFWVKLGLPERVVREQLGHVDEKLIRAVYGHGNVGALAEIDAAFGHNVTPLKTVKAR